MTGSGAADAVSVVTASPDRVTPPCPYSGPDACGGCDFQHVSVPAQRDLKAAVVREQFARLAKLDVEVVVEPVPGDENGLRWRTRQRYVSLPEGRVGLRKHRSHEVVPVEECLIQAREAASHEVLGRAFSVAPDGFWQVHPGAAAVLVETVLDFLDPQPGEGVLDLYAGVGLFAAFLADRVGSGARVVAVEGEHAACRHARRNLRIGSRRSPRVPSTRCWHRRTTSRSTSSCSTRPARAPSARSSSRSSTAPPARSPTSPATRRRSPATSRSSPSTATGAAAAGLRPVPDDFPRGVRSASCEKRLRPAVM